MEGIVNIMLFLYQNIEGKILRELCKWKGVNIIETEVCVDHVHMLIEEPSKMSISGFM